MFLFSCSSNRILFLEFFFSSVHEGGGRGDIGLVELKGDPGLGAWTSDGVGFPPSSYLFVSYVETPNPSKKNRELTA